MRLELGQTPQWSHCGEKWGTTARKIGVFHAPPKERIFTLQPASKCVTRTAQHWADDAVTTPYLVFFQLL